MGNETKMLVMPTFTEAHRAQMRAAEPDWGPVDDLHVDLLIALSGKTLVEASAALERTVAIMLRAFSTDRHMALRGAEAWAHDFLDGMRRAAAIGPAGNA